MHDQIIPVRLVAVLRRHRGLQLLSGALHVEPVPLQVPFVATRDGYRREGHCRLLMQVCLL